jgi:hypothetical protein
MGRRKTGYLLYIVIFIIATLFYLRWSRIEGFEASKQKPKGVILELIGGLGNQLYIYSAGKMIEKSLGTPIFLIPPSEHVNFKNIHSTVDYRSILFSSFTPMERDDIRFSEKIDVRVENKFWDPWSPDSIPSTDKYVFIPQQWYQHFPSIQPVLGEVRESITASLDRLYPNVEMNDNSAFIHVRRGDYNKSGNDIFLLSMQYYNKALESLNKVDSINIYYIFSDDIEWCKQQQWNTTKQIQYIDEQDEMKSLYMMSMCKSGAIISNSTFSTWGAILGAYESGGTIVYPSKWLYGASTEFPQEWIRIDI